MVAGCFASSSDHDCLQNLGLNIVYVPILHHPEIPNLLRNSGNQNMWEDFPEKNTYIHPGWHVEVEKQPTAKTKAESISTVWIILLSLFVQSSRLTLKATPISHPLHHLQCTKVHSNSLVPHKQKTPPLARSKHTLQAAGSQQTQYCITITVHILFIHNVCSYGACMLVVFTLCL